MDNEKKSNDLAQDIESAVSWVKKLEPDLFKDFVKYWTIRKSPPSVASNLINDIRNIDTNNWINLIESNHKFRIEYGEDAANELVSIIESKSY